MSHPELPFPAPHTLARFDDPITSHEAAASLAQLHITQTRSRILDILRLNRDGLTDEQIADRFPSPHAVWPDQWSPSGLRTRRSELVAGGLVVDTGRKARTRSGRRAIVWGLPK